MAILNLEAIPGLLIVGTDVQAWDAQLDDIAALAVTDGNFIVGDGTNWVAESGATARTSLELGTMAVEAAADYVEIAGDTMTGPLVIDDNSATALLVEQDGVNDNTLVVDTTNGRVGIGVAPTDIITLRVEGKGIYAKSASGNACRLAVERPDGSWGALIAGSGNANFFVENGASFSVIEAAADDTPLDDTYAGVTSVLTVVGGDVGIRTTNPEARLHVSGGSILVNNNRGLQGKASGGTARNLIKVDASNDVLISSTSLNGIKIYDDTGEVITLDGSGRVGIGATSPAAKLHVDQASTTGAIPVLYLDQADVSEEMIEFATTIGVGNAIEAVDGKTLTTTHFIKVTLPGPLTRYIPVGTIA